MQLNIPTINSKAAEAGIWLEYQPGISFKIARKGHADYAEGARQFMRENRAKIEAKEMTDDEATLGLKRLLALHVIKGWKGLKDGKKSFPFNEKNVIEIMTNRDYGHLQEWVDVESMKLENYKYQSLKP